MLAPFGLGMSSGDSGDVGVGGLATTGGIGQLVRKHGLTIDHVLAAELVLADGAVVRADAEQHPDLFWALRGAGANFGIVTAFELAAYPVRDVVFSTMTFQATSELLQRWGQIIQQAPRELTSFLTPQLAHGLLGLVESGIAPMAQIRSIGGAVNDIDPTATAYAHRSQNFATSAYGASPARLNQRWDTTVAPHINGIYLSFDTDQRPERLRDAFPDETLTRWRHLKALYDPDNVFNQNFSIPPATDRYRDIIAA
jgi:hypothetical protein